MELVDLPCFGGHPSHLAQAPAAPSRVVVRHDIVIGRELRIGAPWTAMTMVGRSATEQVGRHARSVNEVAASSGATGTR